ncbi:MAG: O-antigen ligase family protein [Firmicutes bacterium]|nr:O-antigen ligase family protein [Bacillota bacterium]
MSNKKQKKYYAKRAAAVKSANTGKALSDVRAHSAASKKRSPPHSPLFDSNNLCEIFARIFLIAMAIVFPLAIGSQKYGNITNFKNTTYYMIAALSFSALIITLIIKILKIPAEQFRVIDSLKFFKNFNAIDVAVSCYWIFLLISALLSDYKVVSWMGQGVRNDGLVIQTFYVITYFVISRLVRLRKFDLGIYCGGAAIVAILVMCHFFGWDVLDTGFSTPNWESGLLFMGPMGNINLTSYFVTVAIILSASLYITDEQDDSQTNVIFRYFILACFVFSLWAELNLNTDAGIVALGVALLVSFPMLLTSFARLGRMLTVLAAACGVILFDRLFVHLLIIGDGFGKIGWISLCSGIILTVPASLIRSNIIRFTPSRRTMLISSLAVDGAAVAGVLTVSAIAAKSQTSGVLYELGQMLFHGNFDDNFGSNRLFTWKRTLKLAGKHPIFGSGPDTFCNVFKEAYGEESEKFFGGRNLDKAHNEYLQLLICSGVTGLGAFLAFIGGMIVKAFRRATDNPLLVCCAMGVVGYAVHAFFGYSLPINSPLMWVLFGLTGAAVRIDKK